VYSQARKSVLKETHGHYPAPLKVLEILPRVARGPIPEALALEARAVGELLVTPEHKNLLSIFFLTEGAKKDPPTPEAIEIARCGVLGAGVMGGGIAYVLADAGVDVRLKDVAPEAVGKGLKAAYDGFRKRVQRRRMPHILHGRRRQLQVDGHRLANQQLNAGLSDRREALELRDDLIDPDTRRDPEDTTLVGHRLEAVPGGFEHRRNSDARQHPARRISDRAGQDCLLGESDRRQREKGGDDEQCLHGVPFPFLLPRRSHGSRTASSGFRRTWPSGTARCFPSS